MLMMLVLLLLLMMMLITDASLGQALCNHASQKHNCTQWRVQGSICRSTSTPSTTNAGMCEHRICHQIDVSGICMRYMSDYCFAAATTAAHLAPNTRATTEATTAGLTDLQSHMRHCVQRSAALLDRMRLPVARLSTASALAVCPAPEIQLSSGRCLTIDVLSWCACVGDEFGQHSSCGVKLLVRPQPTDAADAAAAAGSCSSAMLLACTLHVAMCYGQAQTHVTCAMLRQLPTAAAKKLQGSRSLFGVEPVRLGLCGKDLVLWYCSHAVVVLTLARLIIMLTLARLCNECFGCQAQWGVVLLLQRLWVKCCTAAAHVMQSQLPPPLAAACCC
jgi:hypothetical protein